MREWETINGIERDHNKVDGRWVFRGTRVPVSALFENLRDGATVEEFLDWFPGVERSQVEAVLDYEETLEDWALLQAIREGENSGTASRKAVFARL